MCKGPGRFWGVAGAASRKWLWLPGRPWSGQLASARPDVPRTRSDTAAARTGRRRCNSSARGVHVFQCSPRDATQKRPAIGRWARGSPRARARRPQVGEGRGDRAMLRRALAEMTHGTLQKSANWRRGRRGGLGLHPRPDSGGACGENRRGHARLALKGPGPAGAAAEAHAQRAARQIGREQSMLAPHHEAGPRNRPHSWRAVDARPAVLGDRASGGSPRGPPGGRAATAASPSRPYKREGFAQQRIHSPRDTVPHPELTPSATPCCQTPEQDPATAARDHAWQNRTPSWGTMLA